MRFSPLLLLLVLGACSSLPDLPENKEGFQRAESFLIEDLTKFRSSVLGLESGVAPYDLSRGAGSAVVTVRTYRVRPASAQYMASGLSEGRERSLELEGSVGDTAFRLTMSYRQNQPEVKQRVEVGSSSDWSLKMADTETLQKRGGLPFVLAEGQWRGALFSVRCLRDWSVQDDPVQSFLFGWLFALIDHPESGQTSGSVFEAFRSPNQIYQLVGENGVWGELDRRGCRISLSATSDEQECARKILGVVRSLSWFYDQVRTYRTEWGPETRNPDQDGSTQDFEYRYLKP